MISDLQLRTVVASDLPVFFEHQRDPEAVRMAAFPSRDQAAFTAHWARIATDATVVIRTVIVGGQVAGNLLSWEKEGIRLVGYWLGREYWGRGIASRALAEYLQIVKTRPLHALVAAHNLASLRVLQKCGFVISAGPASPAPGPGAGVKEFRLILVRA